MATANSSLEPGESGALGEEKAESAKAAIIKRLEELEPSLNNLAEIADAFHDIPLICMSETTKMELCYRLDPQSDIQTDEDNVKDYRGMAEWVQLDPAFIKYLTRTECKWKTTEVLAKWSTLEVQPRPTLGNLQRCLCGEGGIDRPDVITDLAPIINRDAFQWEMEKYRANTTKPEIKDDSWQLTIQDVITGKKTYYTACLVYADEDDGMAELIHKLYLRCYPQATFFRPQFDMKRGKFEMETTGTVIQERCGGKVIFLLSKYFFASEVCQFAVNFSAAVCKGAALGKLIPFQLTSDEEHIPIVLKGRTGIRWFRKDMRRQAWRLLTDTILAEDVQQADIEALYTRIYDLLDYNPSLYLGEAPYEEGMEPPGAPIEIIEPEGITEILEDQQKAFHDKFDSSPPNPLSRRVKFVNVISSIKTKLFSDIDQPSSVSQENGDVESINQTTASNGDKIETGLEERQHIDRRNFKTRLACFLSRKGICVKEAGGTDRSADRHSVQTNKYVMVEEGSFRAEVNLFDESCRVLTSPDLSSVMFKRKSNQGDTGPADTAEHNQNKDSAGVTFFSSSPEEIVQPVEEYEVSLDVNNNAGARLGDDNLSHQNSVEDREVANMQGVENKTDSDRDCAEREDEGFILL